MNSEICFSTLEVLHCLLVCLALSFFSHHVCFEKAGIPQKEAGVGLVGGVCWIEWRERIDYGKTCGWTSDRPILSPPCGGCKGCLLKMSCLSRSVGPWHAVLRWGAGSGVSKGCVVLPTAFFSFFVISGGWNVCCHDSGCFYLRLIYLHARKRNGSHPLALYTLPFRYFYELNFFLRLCARCGKCLWLCFWPLEIGKWKGTHDGRNHLGCFFTIQAV